MASEMKAIQALSARVKLTPPTGINEVADYITGRTGIVRSVIESVLQELQGGIVHYAVRGHPVKLPWLGIFKGKFNKDGSRRIICKLDKSMDKAFNDEEYTGHITNRDMIGKSKEEIIQRWNLEHPDDPVKVKKKK